MTGTTNRKLKVFALVQIAASFVLVAAAAATVNTLLSLERVQSGFDTPHMLAVKDTQPGGGLLSGGSATNS